MAAALKQFGPDYKPYARKPVKRPLRPSRHVGPSAEEKAGGGQLADALAESPFKAETPEQVADYSEIPITAQRAVGPLDAIQVWQKWQTTMQPLIARHSRPLIICPGLPGTGVKALVRALRQLGLKVRPAAPRRRDGRRRPGRESSPIRPPAPRPLRPRLKWHGMK